MTQTANNRLQARRVLLITLALNILVSSSELLWGFHTRTLSLTADGFHSLLDAVSNVVAIVGLAVAAKPADKEHPYGHQKFEALAAIFISFFIFLTCYEVLSAALGRIFSPEAEVPVYSVWSYVIKGGVVAINIFVAWLEASRGRALNNQLLIADSRHTMSDIYVSLSVLVTIFAIQMQWYWLDTAVALIIVLVVFHTGYTVIMAHLGTLVDEIILDPGDIKQTTLAVPGVKGCHHIRSRGMPDHVFVDLHIQVEPHLSIPEGHKIAHDVEDALRTRYEGRIAEVLVHVEEVGDEDVVPRYEKKL